VQNRFFISVSVLFLKTNPIRLEISLVQFGLKSTVQLGYYSYLLLI